VQDPEEEEDTNKLMSMKKQNKDNKNFGYIRFPLSFLKGLQIDFYFILSFGAANYGQQLKISIYDIVRQVTYHFFNAPEKLLTVIKKKIKRHEFRAIEDETTKKLIIKGELFIDGSRKGFTSDGKKIDPDALDGLADLLMKDKKFYEVAELNCRILRAAQFFKLKITDMENIIKNYKKALEFENTFNTDPWTSVKTEFLLNTMNKNVPLDLFRFVCAVKSKLGKKSFCKIYKKEILNRMFGCKDNKTLNELLENDNDIKKHYEYLSKRYPFDKLIKEAVNKKLVAVIPSNRGYYVSTKYNIKKLKKEVEKQMRVKNSEVKLKIERPKFYSKISLN